MRDAFGEEWDCHCDYYINGGCLHSWFKIAREALRELETRMGPVEWSDFLKRLHMEQIDK